MDRDIILGSCGVFVAVFVVVWLYLRSSATIEMIRRRNLRSLREITRELHHGD